MRQDRRTAHKERAAAARVASQPVTLTYQASNIKITYDGQTLQGSGVIESSLTITRGK